MLPPLPNVFCSEHFFKENAQLLLLLNEDDVYRDDDEWAFEYSEFGMSVKACHLAICDWADAMCIAPVTCNTMAKIRAGIADTLLTSTLVAWQFVNDKPLVLAPACNTIMWGNKAVQENVSTLKSRGFAFTGPRKGILSNGKAGIGMMATPDMIMAELIAACPPGTKEILSA